MGNTVLESTGLGSTLKRILYSVSGLYILSTVYRHTGYLKRKQNGYLRYLFKIFDKFIDL